MTFVRDLRDRWRRLLDRRTAVCGINRRNIDLVYRHNARTDYPIADDKLLTKEHLERLGVPVPETLCVCEGLFSIPATLAFIAGHPDVVVKPAHGSGGQGIIVITDRVREDLFRRAGGEEWTLADLHRHLASIVFGAYARGRLEDRGFVERRIRPADVFNDLWRDGLCDVRLLTLMGRPLLAMVRVPTARSGGRANLHQGGLGLAVDIDTGRVSRAFWRGRAVLKHPDTGLPLIGFELPQWVKTRQVATRAAAAVPLGYLGVDVAIDAERGPLVLEINARPGLEIQNVNGVGLGTLLDAQ